MTWEPKHYSPEIKGDLEEYLRKYNGSVADNMFSGPEYFFVIKDKGWMVPGSTCIRVTQNPIPDIGYFVNSDYLLESLGAGRPNMSLTGANKGVYNPNEALKGKIWSIHGLNLSGKKT